MTQTQNKQTLSLRRLNILYVGILMLSAAALVRLVEWQVIRYGELRALLPPSAGSTAPSARNTRGMILDRNGLVLALDVWGYQVYASPKRIGDEGQRRRTAEQLAVVMKKPLPSIWEKLANPETAYVALDYQASLQLGSAIHERHIPGVGVQAIPLRQYPAGAMAAQLIGFVNLSNRGLYGVEEAYHRHLNGDLEPCRTDALDSFQQIHVGVRGFQPTLRACDVVLTLDWAIQDLVERELAAGMERTRAAGGTAIVVEPATGKILAMASLPAFDLNKFFESKDTLYVNPAISVAYEPGSVIKIVTIAAGLDSGRFAPNSAMWDSGEIIVGGARIRNWDGKGHGRATMTECLAKSLNVCAAYVSTSLGPQVFYDYVRRFGFTQETGIDLANEVSGQMRFPGQQAWHVSDLGTNSFGQGMTATPLQVAMMASAIANGGIVMKPMTVEAIVSHGQLQTIEPRAARRVISSDTARQLSAMLADAVEQESIPAIIATARVAGKTGTASIPNPRTGRYDQTGTIASFVGWAPFDNPKFVVLVKLDKPQTSEFGSLAAAPVFREIAKKLMVLLDATAQPAG